MHLLTIITALLLPLAAVASPDAPVSSNDLTTTTMTSYVTLTQTITLERAALETVTAVKNNTAAFTTGAPSTKVTTAASPLPTGGAAMLGASSAGIFVMVGAVAAVLL